LNSLLSASRKDKLFIKILSHGFFLLGLTLCGSHAVHAQQTLVEEQKIRKLGKTLDSLRKVTPRLLKRYGQKSPKKL
jgi:hypothetical protein